MSDGELATPGGDGERSPESQDAVSVDTLAAALRQDTADLEMYARVLSTSLADTLPGAVRLDRKRSVADRMAGREGRVTGLDVALGESRLGLRLDRGRVVGEVCKEVRGVVLSRQQVGLDTWLHTLAQAISDAAASSASAREALRRFVLGE